MGGRSARSASLRVWDPSVTCRRMPSPSVDSVSGTPFHAWVTVAAMSGDTRSMRIAARHCGPPSSRKSAAAKCWTVRSWDGALRPKTLVRLNNATGYSITGIENSPPSLMPDGQRAVTVLVRV